MRGWRCPMRGVSISRAVLLGAFVSISQALGAASPATAPLMAHQQQAIEALRTDDTKARQAVLKNQSLLYGLPHTPEFRDALIAATTDADGYTRGRAFIPIGQIWIWNAKEQDAK